MAGGVKNFLGAGKTVIGNGLSNAWQTVSQSKVGSTVLGVGSKVAGAASKIGGGALGTVKGALNVGGAGLNVLSTTVGPVAAKLGGGFMSLLGTFGPVITGIGTIVAAVSLLGDHFEDIRNIVGTVFGEGGLAVFDKFTGKIAGIGDTVKQVFGQLTTPEGLQSIQEKLSGFSIGGLNLGDVFGAMTPAIQTVMPLIESFAGVFSQIVDLGVNHIKPVLTEIFGFIVNEGIPAVMPLLSTVVSLVGTTLVNAIKVAVDLVGKVLPVVEPVILGIIGFLKQVATIGVKAVNFIIGALNKIQLTIPETLFGIPVPYLKDLYAHPVEESLAQLDIPILVMQGENDFQMDTADYKSWQKALENYAGEKEFVLWPELNHLFVRDTAFKRRGTIAEYLQEGHVDQAVTDKIASWMLKMN